jgi:hypothetical protein
MKKNSSRNTHRVVFVPVFNDQLMWGDTVVVETTGDIEPENVMQLAWGKLPQGAVAACDQLVRIGSTVWYE